MLKTILKNQFRSGVLVAALTVMTSVVAWAAPLPKGYSTPFVTGISTNDVLYNNHEPITQELITMVEHSPELKSMLVKSIGKAKKINPDKNTNPAQTLDEYYAYVDWAAKALPWKILPVADHYSSLYNSIDQSLGYFYFINDIPLEELAGKGLYNNSIQYVEPYRSWLINFTANYGLFLSTKESWNKEYYARAKEDGSFHLNDGTYESPANWHSFNDFFARYLSSPAARPISKPDDTSVMVAPADSKPQGIWKIDKKSRIVGNEKIAIKSGRFSSVEELLGTSAYRKDFAGGTLTHTFLDVNDYHRYHFPVSGTIKEVKIIHGDDAAGGITIWDKKAKKYVLLSNEPGWQMFETRGLVVVDTDEYGLVAILPIAMSQVSSVCFEKNVKPGVKVKKGEMFGCFLFGGSDIVMLFQKGIKVEMLAKPNGKGGYSHINMGNEYAKLSK